MRENNMTHTIRNLVDKVVIGRKPCIILEELETTDIYNYQTRVSLDKSFESLLPDWTKVVSSDLVVKYQKDTDMGKFMFVAEYVVKGLRVVLRWPIKMGSNIVLTTDKKGKPKEVLNGRKYEGGEGTDSFYVYFLVEEIHSSTELTNISKYTTLISRFVKKVEFAKPVGKVTHDIEQIRKIANELGFRLTKIPTT